LRYSETDTLTRLLNRKTFEDSLSSILATMGRAATLAPDRERRRHDESRDDWLAVMDIDHFKLVNDRYGHLFGDEVLILVADEMRRVFRRFDKLFRFGGEEFVVILRHTTERNAIRVFERFRHEIEKRDFPQVGRVTISIGATRILANDSSTTLLGRADDALYYAKEHGRNQLRFHETLVATGDLKKPSHEMTVELF
jgi:diguanylate cyclase (GGDEF)-like protein